MYCWIITDLEFNARYDLPSEAEPGRFGRDVVNSVIVQVDSGKVDSVN